MSNRKDPAYEYEYEPRRIRKGTDWGRRFFAFFGMTSAREKRIRDAEDVTD